MARGAGRGRVSAVTSLPEKTFTRFCRRVLRLRDPAPRLVWQIMCRCEDQRVVRVVRAWESLSQLGDHERAVPPMLDQTLTPESFLAALDILQCQRRLSTVDVQRMGAKVRARTTPRGTWQ
jgi:hypothetical protein